MQITENAHMNYKEFVSKHCPRDSKGEIVLCKDCELYRKRCRHPSHPKQPLFTR